MLSSRINEVNFELTIDESILRLGIGIQVQCQQPTWNVSDEQIALLSSFVFFGMLVGTPCWGVLGDLYGRKPIMFIVAIISALLSVLRTASNSFNALLALQFLLGVSLSGFGVAFTYYIEFFPTAYRAKWSMYLTIFWSFGMILGTLVAWTSEFSTWREMIWISTVPLILNVFAMASLLRSPRFLVSKGRIPEARSVLMKISSDNGRPFPARFSLIEARHYRDGPDLSSLPPSRVPFCASCGSRYIRTTLLLYIIWFCLGLIYYAAMMMVSTVDDARAIIANGGRIHANATTNLDVNEAICALNHGVAFTNEDYVDSLIGSCAELPGILVAYVFVDRAGRKHTQTFTILGCALAFVILALAPYNAQLDAAMLIFVRALSNAALSVTWIYTPEVYPAAFRTSAFAISECFSHLGSMLSPFLAQTLTTQGYLVEVCWILCVGSVLCAMASFSLKVETKGKSLSANAFDQIAEPMPFASSSTIQRNPSPVDVSATEHNYNSIELEKM